MLALLMVRYCNMQGKHKNDEHQLWRLKVSITILHLAIFIATLSILIISSSKPT